jgi:hypothetical protein
MVRLRNVLYVQVTENMLGGKKVTVVFVLGICSIFSNVQLFVSYLIKENELITASNLNELICYMGLLCAP